MGAEEEFAGLLEEAQAGSQDALWHLVERVSPYLYRVVRRRMQPALRRRYDSTDFVQMALASFLLRDSPLTEFTSEKHLLGYIAGIAVNKVLMGARDTFERPARDARREVDLEASDAGILEDSGPSPSHVVQYRELWEQQIESRPQRVRRIVSMRIEGRTCLEIAEELDINEKTVRRTLKDLFIRVAA